MLTHQCRKLLRSEEHHEDQEGANDEDVEAGNGKNHNLKKSRNNLSSRLQTVPTSVVVVNTTSPTRARDRSRSSSSLTVTKHQQQQQHQQHRKCASCIIWQNIYQVFEFLANGRILVDEQDYNELYIGSRFVICAIFFYEKSFFENIQIDLSILKRECESFPLFVPERYCVLARSFLDVQRD